MGLGVVVIPLYFESLGVPEHSFFNQLLSSDPSSAPCPIIDQDDTSAILYSFGTSGLSKVVMLSYRNLISVVELFVVQPILMAMTRVKDLGGCDLESLKQVSCGEAPLSRKTIHEFLQDFPHVEFFQGYGMTESTAVGTRGFNTEYFQKYTSVGLLAPNTEAKVVHWDTGSCLSPGKSGELWLCGSGIIKDFQDT
ncbi:hypothetical protein MKX01_022802 [Papaver californicum]|nr:hypothetical protein MKX01_022802 [Papaver californicum]